MIDGINQNAQNHLQHNQEKANQSKYETKLIAKINDKQRNYLNMTNYERA